MANWLFQITRKSRQYSRSQTFCLSTLHPLQAGSGHPALLWMECLCRGDTVRKGDTASCSHVPTLILWSPQAPTTIPDQPLAPERVGLNGQQGPWINLVDQTQQLNPWYVASDVTGGTEAGTEAHLSQNSCLCFSWWSLHAAHTPHLN